jgi:hypothetical protein
VGGAYFGRKAFRDSNSHWHSRSRRQVTVGRHFGEAAVPEGKCGRAASLHYTLAFSLQLRKNRKTLSQGSRKVPNRTVVDTIRLVELTVVLRAASTGLLTIITLGLPSMWRRQPSVSANTCRVAELRGSPHRITSSRNSRLGLRCGRQTTEHQNPSKFSCYCCTKVHQYQREDT